MSAEHSGDGNGQSLQPESLIQWRYQRLFVFHTYQRYGDYYKIIHAKDGRWRVDFERQKELNSGNPPWVFFLADKMILDQKNLYLPLNSERDWAQTMKSRGGEWLTWDEEASYADLVDGVIGKFGRRGWELIGIQLATMSGEFSAYSYPDSFYIFKKPRVKTTTEVK